MLGTDPVRQAAKQTIRRRVTRLLQPVAAPVLSAAILVHACIALSTSRRWELHTYEVLQSISAATQTLDEAVRRQQNYILTGDRSALALLYVTFERLHASLSAIARLTADNPRQQASIAEGRPVLDGALRLVAQGVARRHAGEVDREEAGTLWARLDAEVAQVKLVFDRLADEEHALLLDRAEASRDAEFGLILGAVATGLLALASLATAIGELRKEDDAAGPIATAQTPSVEAPGA